MAQPSREQVIPLEEYLQTVAFVAKSLSDENRLRILLCVNNGKKSVSGIVEALNLSQPLVSHHLKELRRAGLIRVARRGKHILCWVDRETVLAAANLLTGGSSGAGM